MAASSSELSSSRLTPVDPSTKASTDIISSRSSGNTTGLRQRPGAVTVAKHQQRSPDQHGVRVSGDKTGLDGAGDAEMSFTSRNQWVLFAVASGACAAFNGVFAKLTTNDLTTNIVAGISRLFGIPDGHVYIELVVRVIFFSLNLVFNGVMWTLFTQALAKGNSTTQVSIMNTSTNFMITALLGFIIFSESLPPLWWLGASMLVAGNVIIGRKDAGGDTEQEHDASEEADDDGAVVSRYRDDVDADENGLDDGGYRDDEESGRRRREEDEDVAQIGNI